VLTERSRAVLHRRLTEVVQDEEAVSEMLSNFPSDDRDPLVTKSMLDIGLGELRADMHHRTTQLLMWMIGIAIAGCGVLVAAMGILV
jgi:hypothetical protein